MIIKPTDNVSFGYHSPLKTLWLKGKLPTVKKGFYGDELTIKTVSLEHLQPKSKGGKSNLENFVIASKRLNNLRGNQPLDKFIRKDKAREYLYQFIDVKIPEFDGNRYIRGIINKLKSLNINLF